MRRLSLVAIVGAGPVGLALGARLRVSGRPFMILEAGGRPAEAVGEWAHIRMFSPWSWNIDAVAADLLAGRGWRAPPDEKLPTGGDLRTQYLTPLADHLSPNIQYRFDVASITSVGAPGEGFELLSSGGGQISAGVVIDASGVWRGKNGLGARGGDLDGEQDCRALIDYGPTDVLSKPGNYAEKTVLVVGGGHSGMHAALDLAAFGGTGRVLWASHRPPLDSASAVDRFPGRAALHHRANEAIRTGAVTLVAPFTPISVRRTPFGVRLRGTTDDGLGSLDAQRVIVATGFRPDTALASRAGAVVDADIESPAGLAPVIRSRTTCGDFPPFELAALSHPVPGLFTAGIKSFGRASNFDLQVGYRQADLIAHALTH